MRHLGQDNLGPIPLLRLIYDIKSRDLYHQVFMPVLRKNLNINCSYNYLIKIPIVTACCKTVMTDFRLPKMGKSRLVNMINEHKLG